MDPATPEQALSFHRFDAAEKLAPEHKAALAGFLHLHLGQYGDPLPQIQDAMAYAVEERKSFGGFVLECRKGEQTVGVVVINKTGMGGYIPENILVYIAVDSAQRGLGIGKRLMEEALRMADGDVALHVEQNNPAKRLYERIGFSNPYLEMRYKARG